MTNLGRDGQTLAVMANVGRELAEAATQPLACGWPRGWPTQSRWPLWPALAAKHRARRWPHSSTPLPAGRWPLPSQELQYQWQLTMRHPRLSTLTGTDVHQLQVPK